MRVAKPLKALIKASESDSTGPEQICMQWLDTRSELSSLSASHYGNAANKKQMLLYFEKNLSRAHKEAVTAAAAAAAANDVDLYVSSDLHEESELELEDSLFESD